VERRDNRPNHGEGQGECISAGAQLASLSVAEDMHERDGKPGRRDGVVAAATVRHRPGPIVRARGERSVGHEQLHRGPSGFGVG
jgi:hypothetical protein